MSKLAWMIVLKVTVFLVFLSLALAYAAEPTPKVVITWADTSTGEEFYEVQRGQAVNGPWTTMAKTGPDVTRVEDLNVVVGQSVCYRARAGTAAVQTAYSVAKCVTVPNTLVVPSIIVTLEPR